LAVGGQDDRVFDSSQKTGRWGKGGKIRPFPIWGYLHEKVISDSTLKIKKVAFGETPRPGQSDRNWPVIKAGRRPIIFNDNEN